MSLKDRRELGVNFFSVLRTTKDLMEDPEFQAMNQLEMAEKILEKISEKKLSELAEEGLTTDEILEWIIKILPYVLQILILFI